MNLRALLRFFLAPAVRPRQTVRDLLQDRHKLGYGLIIYLFLGAIYTFSVQMAYARGFGAQVAPFLRIAAERYYFWQRFFQIPLFLLTNVVFAGTARLLAAACGGRGSYEDIFALCCTAMTLPMFVTMWLPETLFFFLLPPDYAPAGAWKAAYLLFNILRQAAGVLWPLAIIGTGLAKSERIGGWAAAAVTLLAFLPTGALIVIFIR